MIQFKRYSCGCIGFDGDLRQRGADGNREVVIVDPCDDSQYDDFGPDDLILAERTMEPHQIANAKPLDPDENLRYVNLMRRQLSDGIRLRRVKSLLTSS